MYASVLPEKIEEKKKNTSEDNMIKKKMYLLSGPDVVEVKHETCF